MFVLVEGGTLYGPEPRGKFSLLAGSGSIVKVGEVSRQGRDRLGIAYEVLDARDCVVVPGFIDPHEHIAGGSGEGGFGRQTPDIRAGEIVSGGITTVVGCIGVDTTMKNMAALLGRAKALKESGVSAYVWSGGYDVPPATLTGSVRRDILFVEEVIGAGEIAISDERSTEPDARELARIVHEAFIGGHLSGKAGVTHFHVGPGPRRLAILRTVLDEFDVKPESLYPTHLERDEKLMDEAVDLARRGVTVDIDVVEKDLAKWLPYYRDRGGPLDRLTVSSDASITSPGSLLDQVRQCVRDAGVPLETILSLVTSNTARVLKLRRKGRLVEGADADVTVLDAKSLELRHVVAGEPPVYRDGSLVIKDEGLPPERALKLVAS